MNNKTHDMLKGWRIHVFGVAACLLVAGLMYVVLIAPTINTQKEHARLMPLVSEKQESLRNARFILTELKQSLEDTQAQVQALPLRLDSASQVNSRLARIADLAATAGLEVHAMQPEDTWGGDRFDTVPIVLTGEGDYRKITGFMRQVNEQLADIAVIGFTMSSKDSISGRAEFGIGLAWYTMPAMGMVEN